MGANAIASLQRKLADVRLGLAEGEQTLHAIRHGEVDAVRYETAPQQNFSTSPRNRRAQKAQLYGSSNPREPANSPMREVAFRWLSEVQRTRSARAHWTSSLWRASSAFSAKRRQ